MNLPDVLEELQKIEKDLKITVLCEGNKARKEIANRKWTALREAIKLLEKY